MSSFTLPSKRTRRSGPYGRGRSGPRPSVHKDRTQWLKRWLNPTPRREAVLWRRGPSGGLIPVIDVTWGCDLD
jgi:hypothetical protein